MDQHTHKSMPWNPLRQRMVELIRSPSADPVAPPDGHSVHALIDQSRAEGVQAQVYEGLRRTGIRLPILERELAFAALHQQWMRRSLDELLRAFATADVQVVPLKGPLLAERLYARPDQRPCGDLDLLVSRRDMESAIKLLSQFGYGCRPGPTSEYYRRHHHHLELLAPSGPLIELHFRLFTGFSVCMEADEFLQRAAKHTSSTGIATWLLAPEDEFLYLAVHAAGHVFSRLAWLLDLEHFLQRHPDLCWRLVLTRARAAGVETVLLLVIHKLRQELGVQIPELPHEARRRGRFRCASQFECLFANALNTPTQTISRLAYHAVLAPSMGWGLWYLGHHLWRIVRRRAVRWLPWLPAAWAA